jgi:hypothetical protein
MGVKVEIHENSRGHSFGNGTSNYTSIPYYGIFSSASGHRPLEVLRIPNLVCFGNLPSDNQQKNTLKGMEYLTQQYAMWVPCHFVNLPFSKPTKIE